MAKRIVLPPPIPEDPDADAFQFRLAKDLRDSAETLTAGQVRYLVDTYYQVQDFRIQAGGQSRHALAAKEPHALVSWLGSSMKVLERSIVSALTIYTDVHLETQWAKSICGIGPVIAAGLKAHIDVNPWRCARAKADRAVKPCRVNEPHGPECQRVPIKTAGAVWRFAGLDPTVTWGKNEKRPWNARLKVLTWKIGESFVKVKGRPQDIYGKLYEARKLQEIERNTAGAFRDQATAILAAKRWRKETISRVAYESGKLPDGHVHARAKRWAVKLFLAHYHHVAYEVEFGVPPPMPYVISVLGHGDYLAPPGWAPTPSDEPTPTDPDDDEEAQAQDDE